jgi:hypothetical protein
MILEKMFQEDINRKINGVVQVEQDDDVKILVQEVEEYVVTKELRKHFITFFNNYSESFDNTITDTGVWISGFFGSGKSHFLKMLSYILENREIDGIKTVERFRKKFADDPGTFMLIDKSTQALTETILFNVDIEGFSNKDNTAVLRVFAKMFYNHMGFYGENLKVAMLEHYIEQSGKTEEFRRVFEEKKGKPWVEVRRAFAFNGKAIIPTLMEVLDMSEEDAKAWYADKTETEISISSLVSDIKDFVDKKPNDYRLLFMIDEMGQYAGESVDLLLNLQSLVEEIGSKCKGKVWVCCTGQEAIDEIIKTRQDQFSRIQARFGTRLSLSSSSADEVIQERILKKTPEAASTLEKIYAGNSAVLRNLLEFAKEDAVLDIKGYTSDTEFVRNFPFVPYQFIIMQKVFNEVRKHGNSGKHLSGGERSMLSGFQEAAQKIKDRDEYALAPFYLFYDTVHTFLDSSIRQVIERCQKAADNHDGIEQIDVNVLKLLYLVRYIDDIKANLNNIVILMADDIRMDKITMREAIRESLDRLYSQNYVGRNGDTYNFLTDEEQDIARDINKNTQVDTSQIVDKIGNVVFGDIYTTKKYRYGIYDFPFDQMIDNNTVGSTMGGMCLRLYTLAMDEVEKSNAKLMIESKGKAIVVLANTPYYELLERAMKIKKYVKTKNVPELPKSVQNIIKGHMEDATKFEADATEEIQKAIEGAEFYVDGEHIEIKSGNAKSKLEQALEYLVTHVYSDLNLIGKNYESDADILAILNGTDVAIPGASPTYGAEAKVEEFLQIQKAKNLPTSMADIQSRYQGITYGWREVDIAAVVARLIMYQKVTIKYAGVTVQPDNPKLPDMLRKKTEIGKTSISIRITINHLKLKEVKEFLRDYYDVMDVPTDEDGIIAFIVKRFTEQKEHYETLNKYYDSHAYPDQKVVQQAIQLLTDVLSQQKDNVALVDKVVSMEDALYDCKDAMVKLENFFGSQVKVFDEAVKLVNDLHNELDYLSKEEESNSALNEIRLITMIQVKNGSFDYKKIPELNGLMAKVHEGHDRLLEAKKEELLEIVRQCLEAIHMAAVDKSELKAIVTKADEFYVQKKERISELKSLALLDGLVPPMLQYKDQTVDKLESASKPTPVTPTVNPSKSDTPTPKKVVKAFNRQVVFPAKKLESDAEIDAYVEKMREQLKQLLKGCDGIQLN